MKTRLSSIFRTIAEILLLPVAAIVTLFVFRSKNGH